MKARTFTTRLIQLNTYLLYFSPDSPGQLVASLPNDDIKKIPYHSMPNAWEKNIVEQRYNYLDGPIHYLADFFEIKKENLEKLILPCDPSRKGKQQPLTIQRMKTWIKGIKDKPLFLIVDQAVLKHVFLIH